MAQFVDFYDILDVAPQATDGEIREAVRKQRNLWIRRQNSPNPQRQAEAQIRVQQIDDAEQTLLDAARRQSYDSTRQARASEDRARPPLPAAGNANEWVSRAEEYLAAGDAKRAQFAAREATTANQNDSTAWQVRARASFMLGNHEEAEFELGEAARRSPDDVDILLDLIDVQAQIERFDDAYATLQRAEALRPGDLQVGIAGGVLDLMAGRSDDALVRLSALHEKHPSDPNVAMFLAAAVEDAILSRMTEVEPGVYAFTSQPQVDFAKQNLPKAEGLSYPDTDQREAIERLRAMTVNAERRRHVRRDGVKPYLIALVLALIFMSVTDASWVVQWLLLLAVPAIYVLRHWRPVWRAEKISLDAAGQEVVRWGI